MKWPMGLWTGCLLLLSGLCSAAQAPPNAFLLPMEITNRNFSPALRSPASTEYRSLNAEVNRLLFSIYGCPACPMPDSYGGTVEMTFSAGSVIANATLVFHTNQVNPSVVYYLFEDNAALVRPQVLQLNLDFTTLENVRRTSEILVTPTTTRATTTSQPSKTTTPPTTTTEPTTTNQRTTTTTTTTPPTTTTEPTTTNPKTTTTEPTTTTATTVTTKPTTTATPTQPSTSSISAGKTTPTTRRRSTARPSDAPTNLAPTRHPSSTPFGRSTVSRASSTSGRSGPTSSQVGTPTPTQRPGLTTAKPSGGIAGGGVPGWGIALLVLAAAILLLLIIIFIMMVVRWCCANDRGDPRDLAQDPYYGQRKQPPHSPLPVYSPQVPQAPQAPLAPQAPRTPGSTPVIIGDTPRKTKTGFYAVNP